MINEEKVRLMNQIAMYEEKEGKKYLPVSKYYRSDYVGVALIKNFFLVTIGYMLILLALGGYYGDYLMENIHKMNLVALGTEIVAGYLIVLAAFTVLTYIQYTVKYFLAKKSVKKYYAMLTKLSKMYVQEEKKNRTSGRRG